MPRRLSTSDYDEGTVKLLKVQSSIRDDYERVGRGWSAIYIDFGKRGLEPQQRNVFSDALHMLNGELVGA